MAPPVVLALLLSQMHGTTPPPSKAGPNEAIATFDPESVADTVGQPKPITNPGSWATSADYPAIALREGRAGVVRFTVTVDLDGTVSKCEVTASSGSGDLDAATCVLISARARFQPARDAQGDAIVSTYYNSIRWQIPRLELPTPGQLVRSFRVEPDGSITDCRNESATGSASSEVTLGSTPCRSGDFVKGFTDREGKPVARRVRMVTRVEVLPE